jgi:hypothetical protein
MTSCFTGIRAGAVILSFCNDGSWTWPSENKEKIYETLFWAMFRIQDVYPGSRFYPSRIPDLENNKSNKRERGKEFCGPNFFFAPDITKLKIIIFFNWLRKKSEPIYKVFLLQQLSLSSQKYGFGIRDPKKTFSGSQIQGLKRHRIPDPDPLHCFWAEQHRIA